MRRTRATEKEKKNLPLTLQQNVKKVRKQVEVQAAEVRSHCRCQARHMGCRRICG